MSGDDLIELILDWARIDSGSDHVVGVRQMMDAAAPHFTELAERVEWVELPTRGVVSARGEIERKPVGPAVTFSRAGVGPRVLLSGHVDTVFDTDVPRARRDGDILRGPGVADMKGGLVVMLHALRLARTTLPWTVVLTPDEEVGSPSSAALLTELARTHDVGFVFEPALDGALVASRGGSALLDLVLRGKGAHVGRNFADGRSALHLACEAVGVLTSMNSVDGVTVNVGRIDGGGPSNVVADLAVIRLNIRVADADKLEGVTNDLRRLLALLNRRDGMAAELHGGFTCPPKVAHQPLLDLVTDVGQALGVELSTRDTGGVCDGNLLAAAGLPNIDTMGVDGGGLHSADEWCRASSVVERAELTAEVLRRIERAGLPW